MSKKNGIMINYAHRGASAYAPENTMAAFRLGIDMGANGLETDVQRTSDGVLVLYHDDTLQRIAGDPRQVRNVRYAELAAMDFGSWKHPMYSGERIVTLEAFLDAFAEKPLHFAIEIKQVGIEAELLQSLKSRIPLNRLVVTSFYLEALEAARGLDSAVPLGYLARQYDDTLLDQLKALRGYQFCPKASDLNETLMKRLRTYGFSVRAWGVNDEALMRHALMMDVDGMTVNFPDLLRDLLQDLPFHSQLS